MKISLIRHTSVVVPKGLIYGRIDVPLNVTFLAEAKAVYKQIENDNFDIVFSSPSLRTKLLSKEIANDKAVHYDNRLMELDFGIWEGKTWNSLEKTTAATEWFKNYLEIPCPGGESYLQLIARIQEFISFIKEQNFNHVCIITHGGPIRAFISIIESKNPIELFNQKIEFGDVITLYI